MRYSELPTKKQVCFARYISGSLDIPLPETFSKFAYSDYISENIGKLPEKHKSCLVFPDNRYDDELDMIPDFGYFC